VPLLAELGYPSSEGQLRETLERLASTGDDRVFVAEQSTRLVGIASVHRLPLFHAPGYLGRITALVVAAPSRGAGVGRALLAAAEAYAWGAECVRIEVTSGDHRPDAHAFYGRLGYQEDERRFIKRRAEAAETGTAG
jgi:GNAT superfamily N-acetyltransferase